MNEALERRSFLLLLAAVTLLFLYLLKPFFHAIFWAAVVAVMFYPLQRRLLSKWPDRPNSMALATLLCSVVIVVVPVLFVVGSFFQEGASLYQKLESGELDPGAYLDQIRNAFPAVQNFLERFGVDLDRVKEQLGSGAVAAGRVVAENAVSLGQGTLQFFISLALMLYVAFFLLRDGPELIAMLVRALPLGDEREHMLFAKFVEVTRATIKGNLVVAIIQGALGGVIFAVLGIPGALLWGVVMILLSLIPVVGAALIWAPVALYLFATGAWVQGTVLAVFGVGVIGLVDNVLRPILVGRDTRLPDYIVLLSTLGGIAVFGMSGFVIGPLIAVLFAAFWDIFAREFSARTR